MQTNEFYRIPVSALVNVPNDGDTEPIAVVAAKQFGRTMNPVVVILKGMNQASFELMYEIVHNHEMAEVAKVAGLEYVDAFLIKPADILTVKNLF